MLWCLARCWASSSTRLVLFGFHAASLLVDNYFAIAVIYWLTIKCPRSYRVTNEKPRLNAN